jgi:hypothetical protein
VLIDAICRVTSSTENTRRDSEPFTVMPADQRAIALPDGSITSPFLELFGRPARDTGLALERNNRSTAAQRLHLLNSSHIQRKIAQSRLVQDLSRPKVSAPTRQRILLTVLSRLDGRQRERSWPGCRTDSFP